MLQLHDFILKCLKSDSTEVNCVPLLNNKTLEFYIKHLRSSPLAVTDKAHAPNCMKRYRLVNLEKDDPDWLCARAEPIRANTFYQQKIDS